MLLSRLAAAASKDAAWAAKVDGFVHGRVLKYNPADSGQAIIAHSRFQELVEGALEPLLASCAVEEEQLALSLVETSAEDMRIAPRHRACALQILSLDADACFDELMANEVRALRADPVRKAALTALADADWLSAVDGFVAAHAPTFAPAEKQLSWTECHHAYQEALEGGLEAVLDAAGVDPTEVLQMLCAPPTPTPPGVTPLPARAVRPLRAFVEYEHFEQLMKDAQ